MEKFVGKGWKMEKGTGAKRTRLKREIAAIMIFGLKFFP
jgi:hypothetical protein